ncbi:hypothetical protein GcM1_211040 [Golovinomyces cichoracearum]|uniref:Uncharacterized protein n=1 Tax=Golovinomyces cichoracearum TaxID=62708 RepID=A0A420IVA8_9PEZI|nr:hypothetical protein GcM1_211040 [Golovinomyces cichoracearum]
MSDNLSTGSALINKNDPLCLRINLSLASLDDLKFYGSTKLHLYTDEDAFDDDLYSLFHYDFAGWKSSHFEHCGLRLVQKLRKLLRQGGVYMAKSKSDEVFNNLANALKFEYEPWTDDQKLNALREDPTFSFTSPNLSCKINSNPDLYKIAYYNRQKKITNNPPHHQLASAIAQLQLSLLLAATTLNQTPSRTHLQTCLNLRD